MIRWKALLDPTEETPDEDVLEGGRALTIDRVVGLAVGLALLVLTGFVVLSDDGHGTGLFLWIALFFMWAGLVAGWIWPPLYGCATGLAAAAIGLLGLTGFGAYLIEHGGFDPGMRGGVWFFQNLGGLTTVALGGMILLGSLGFMRGDPRGARTLVRSSACLFLASVLVPLAFHAVYLASPTGYLWFETEARPETVAVLFLFLYLVPWWLSRNGVLCRAVTDSVGPVAVIALPERFRFMPRGAERVGLELLDAPENCLALEAAPPERETCLDSGRWLVLCFSPLNGPDREAVGLLLEAATHFTPETFAGVRPFKHPREFATWAPEFAKETRSPIWLVYDRGVLVDRSFGPLDVATLLRRLPEGFVATA